MVPPVIEFIDESNNELHNVLEWTRYILNTQNPELNEQLCTELNCSLE